MSHEEIAKQELGKYFNVKPEEVIVKDRLKGGMSNSNYICEVNHKLYTFRIPGKNAENFVSRKIEKDTLDLISQLGIDGNLLIHMDLETGYKISEYIEGTPLHLLDPSQFYSRAANVLKKLHQSKITPKNEYNPFDRLLQYESLVTKEGLSHSQTYFDILNKFLVYRPFLEKFETVLCHNDSQPSNFIYTIDRELLLVDWEFGGANDFFYDIACFGNNDFKFAEGLLPIYLGKTPTKEDWKRLYLWRTFQCLQWHNVALYKEATGLSKELHLDFKMIAEGYIAKANALFLQALKNE